MAIGGVDSWRFYNPVTGNDGKMVGLVAPGGSKYLFEPGERMGSGFNVVTRSGTEKKVTEWILGKRKEMNALFESLNPMFKRTYLAVLEDYPILSRVNIVGDFDPIKPTATPGSWRRPTKEQPESTVLIHQKDRKDFENILIEREYSVWQIAKMIGVDIAVIKEYPHLVAIFVFAHEFGHANQYEESYRGRFSNPSEKALETRKAELATLPWPGMTAGELTKMQKLGNLNVAFEKNKQYFNAKGIHKSTELLQRTEMAYRDLPSEKFADEFASRIMRRHWQELGLDQLTGIKSPGIR